MDDSSCTVLFVTDDQGAEPSVALSLLEKAGFAIIIAPSAEAALERSRHEKMPIDLAVIDAAVAEARSAEIVQQLHEISPRVRILFLCNEDCEMSQSMTESGHVRRFLRKPFRRSKFLGEVLEMTAPQQVLIA